MKKSQWFLSKWHIGSGLVLSLGLILFPCTVQAEPTSHATDLTFSSVGSTVMTVSWTSGDGASRIVVVREGSATSWTPVDGTAPSGVDADFSAATDQADGNRICYDGSGSSVELRGLSASTTYYVTIYEYDGSGTGVDYLTSGTPLSGSQTTGSATGIWINPMSAGTPMGTYYLGDTLGDWNVNFEIGQTWWNYAQVGLGTSAVGSGYNWGEASWYEDGEGSNKRVRRNLNGYQFVSAGTYYVICQARANSGDAYTSKSGNGWANETAYPPSDLSSAYFTVEALGDPSSVTAVRDTAGNTATRVDLGWSSWSSRNVMITVSTGAPTGSPEQGTAYITGETFGNQTVIAGSQSGTDLEVTGLTPGQTYTFTFYSENYSYYSAGVSATAVTLGMPQARNTSGGSPQTPSSIYLGDTGLTFGFDSWGLIEGNWGQARLWLRYNDADLTGGTSSDWGAYVSDENKTLASGVFDQTGTWYWGMQMNYSDPYGSDFWYKSASTDWADMSASSSDATLTVTVNALNDPSDPQVTGTDIHQIDLSFSQDAQSHSVMVVRKLATDSWTEPAQGTAYSVNDALGAGTVIYKGDGPTVSATGLTDNTTYDFKFYSVNNDYYSAGVTAQGSTPLDPIRPVYATTQVNVREEGEGRVYVALNKQPSDTVVLTTARASGDSGLSVQSGAELTFTVDNWMVGQAVTLTAAKDANSANETAVFETSGSGLQTASIDAVALDIDIGENIALASGGATISGKRMYQTDLSIDGISTDRGSYAYAIWTNEPQGNMTLDLRSVSTISRVRVLNWDWCYRTHTYQIESSQNGTVWTPLVDTGAEGHQGWDDWAIEDVSARYLRFTGLSNSVNNGICIPEWEVYGERAPLPQVVFSKTNVLVREAGEGRFYVRLDSEPESDVTLVVSRSSGSEDITVQEGETLTIKASTWNAWRAVTLAAAEDEDDEAETAVIRVTGSRVEEGFIDAVSLDDDIGDNLALASSGARLSGFRTYMRDEAIDGIHTDRYNYAYAIWTNEPIGYMVLDLQAPVTLSRIRLLNWDWGYRTHKYTIESSEDGSDWATLVDATAEGHQGWDDWEVSVPSVRYLRFTGITNSVDKGICIPEWEVYGSRPQVELLEFAQSGVNVREGGQGRFYVRMTQAPSADITYAVSRSIGDEGITVQSGSELTFTPSNWNIWRAVTLAAAEDADSDGETAIFQLVSLNAGTQYMEATALDDDIGENLALASGGTTLSGTRAYLLPLAIDGVHDIRSNYEYMFWSGSKPGTMTLDMQEVMTVSRIRLLNWDWGYREHRYTIEASTDGTSWSTLIDGSAEGHQGWDDWAVEDESIRYLRFTALSNTANNAVCIPEWEVYGTRPVRRVATSQSASARILRSDGEWNAALVQPVPVSVLTSDGTDDETGWNAVDGDESTAWMGQSVGGGYIVVEYAPNLILDSLMVDVTEDSLTNAEFLYSLDAEEWLPLPEPGVLETEPVELKFLWVIFPDDGSDALPGVIEIQPNP